MKKTKLEVGTVLIAIDPCIMVDTGIPSLTINKEYKITITSKNEFCIVDDQMNNHWYNMYEVANDEYCNEDYWKKYFKLKV